MKKLDWLMMRTELNDHDARAEQRTKRLFGVLTIEHLIQLCVMISLGTAAWVGIQSRMSANEMETERLRERTLKLEDHREEDHTLLAHIDEKVNDIRDSVNRAVDRAQK